MTNDKKYGIIDVHHAISVTFLFILYFLIIATYRIFVKEYIRAFLMIIVSFYLYSLISGKHYKNIINKFSKEDKNLFYILLEKYFLALSSFITSIYFFFFSMLVFGITSYFFIATIMGIFGSLNGSFRQNQILFLTFFIAFLSGYKSIIFIIKWKRREKELDKRK